MSVVFDNWQGTSRNGWISALVSHGSTLCTKCGSVIVLNESAYKHTGDLGTYCQSCSLGAEA